MKNIQEHYKATVIPAMQEQFGYKNVMAVPRIIKVVLNVGVSSSLKDAKAQETIKETLRIITGQAVVARKARISISNFKIRKGQIVGFTTTLRGKRMYDFLERLINLTFPRVRDFRGLNPNSVDERGSFTVGFHEAVAFPEIKAGEIERQHGLEITVVTNAKSGEKGRALLKYMGFPFKNV